MSETKVITSGQGEDKNTVDGEITLIHSAPPIWCYWQLKMLNYQESRNMLIFYYLPYKGKITENLNTEKNYTWLSNFSGHC